MIRWVLHHLTRRLLSRGEILPPLQERLRCAVPGCDRIAEEQWLPSFCALREAGVPPEAVPVCGEHDVELNEMSTRFLFGERYEAELSAYRKSRLGG